MFDPKVFQQDRTPAPLRDAPRPVSDRPAVTREAIPYRVQRAMRDAQKPTVMSCDHYLGRRATRRDYAAYVSWCNARGIRPLATEPLAYGDCPK